MKWQMILYEIGIFFIIFGSLNNELFSVSIGSNTAPSRQPVASFPASDTNNTMLGFAVFEKGFLLADKTTTCTYNNFFPISGTFNLNNGSLFLSKDLATTNAVYFVNGGNIFGNGHDFVLPYETPDVSLLSFAGLSASFSLVASDADFQSRVRTVDWNLTGSYLAVGDENRHFAIAYFNGTTLTTTTAIITQGGEVMSVRWHPQLSYVAEGNVNGAGNELSIYKFNQSTASLTVTGSENYASAVNAVAWHPSGLYLVAGTELNAKELITYTFNTSTGGITEFFSVNLSPDQDVSRNSLSFSPGGNFLASGHASTSSTELKVFSFNAGILTLNSSIEVGVTVETLDWSPTGTFIAVGLFSGSTRLRVYAHDAATSSLSLVATFDTGTDVNAVAWDKTGTLLAVATESTTGSRVKVYHFDVNSLVLTSPVDLPTPNTSDNYAVDWSNNNQYLATGDHNDQANVYSAQLSSLIQPLIFRNTNLIMNSNLNIIAPVQFSGACKVNGRGRSIDVHGNGSITIRPGSSVVFEDVELTGNLGGHFFCMTDRGSIILRNSIISLSRDYTFSRGSILFDEDVLITGTNKFNYTSGLTSTIGTCASVFFDIGTTFSYAPRLPKSSLIFMTDNTSVLYLNGCTLHSTRTGLSINSGTLIFDNKVTLSSEAKNSGEALRLGSGLNINILPNAFANIFGKVTIN